MRPLILPRGAHMIRAVGICYIFLAHDEKLLCCVMMTETGKRRSERLIYLV